MSCKHISSKVPLQIISGYQVDSSHTTCVDLSFWKRSSLKIFSWLSTTHTPQILYFLLNKMAKGSCLCGNAVYEYSGEVVKKSASQYYTRSIRSDNSQVLCHCLTCRKISGSTNTVCFLVPDTDFDFKSSGSSLKVTITRHEAGMRLQSLSCGDCGTYLCKELLEEASNEWYEDCVCGDAG